MQAISGQFDQTFSSYARPREPKFRISHYELEDGNLSASLSEINSSDIIWNLINFPKSGYAKKILSIEDILVISDFGGSRIWLYEIEKETFFEIELDSYEAGKLSLLSEKKKFGESPVIRRHPPGDICIVGRKLFVGQVFSEYLVVIDLASKKLVKRIPVGRSGEMTYNSISGQLYFSSSHLSKIFEINPSTCETKEIAYPESIASAGAILCAPKLNQLYIGLHRTRFVDHARAEGQDVEVVNSYVAIYDLLSSEYIDYISLTASQEDVLERCWPSCMIYESCKNLIYIGMLGSPKNIYILDTAERELTSYIQSSINSKNRSDHADSLSLSFYRDFLIVINRSNYELLFLEKDGFREVLSIPLGGNGNGPSHVCIVGDYAYVSHSEYSGIICVDLLKVMHLIGEHAE